MKMRGFYTDSEQKVQYETNSTQTISSTSTHNDSDFQKIRDELFSCKTHQDCERFIHKYDKVNPLNTILFQKNIELLVSLAKEKSEELFFEENKKNRKGLILYLEKYPNGKYKHQAAGSIRIGEIEKEERSKKINDAIHTLGFSVKVIITVLLVVLSLFAVYGAFTMDGVAAKSILLGVLGPLYMIGKMWENDD